MAVSAERAGPPVETGTDGRFRLDLSAGSWVTPEWNRYPSVRRRVVGTAYYYPLASRSLSVVLSLAAARAR